MEEKNIFKQGVAQAKNYIGEALTGVIAIALVVYSFVQLGLRSELDENFFTTFLIGFIIMIMITSVWYPTAKQKAQSRDEGYITQRRVYSDLVNKVTQENKQKHLAKFCEWATQQNKVYIIKQKLLRLGIDYTTYLRYEQKPSEIYTHADTEEELTEKQKKKLRQLIEHGINVKIILPNKLLTGIRRGNLRYDVSSGETKYDTFSVGSKVFTSIANAVVTAFLAFSVGGFTWASVAQLLLWYMLMVWNMFTSYQAGYKSISIHRKNYYQNLRTFLEEFVSSDMYGVEIIPVEEVEEEVKEEVEEVIEDELEEIEEEIEELEEGKEASLR